MAEMIYLPENPHHIIYFTEDLPNPWVWLTVGIVFAGVFVYAWKLLRRTSANPLIQMHLFSAIKSLAEDLERL